MVQQLHNAEQFVVTQKITLMVNRYDIWSQSPDGDRGSLLATAQQKRTAFKEQVTFYGDEERTAPLFAFRARKRLDLGSGYDVVDMHDVRIGSFRKEFKRSLLRSTWHLEQPGIEATGRERSATVAILRRIGNVPLAVHFDFVDTDGRTVLTSQRRVSARDRYDITVPGGLVDGRLAAAMAVALDALQSR